VVCDLDRFEIHTNFTGTVKKVYTFSLADLDEPEHLVVLKALWTDPNRLRPDTTPEDVTHEAAERFGRLSASLQARGVEPQRAAHFLVQLLFCLFAEDVGLLPRGLFTDLLARSVRQPERFAARIDDLLTAMRDGGDFGAVALNRFNGGLFAEIAVEPLTADELRTLAEAGRLDWASVEPAIFGTLFERSLDPTQRAQLGAHYTGRADIARVVEPVVLDPLRRRWAEVKERTEGLRAQWEMASATATRDRRQLRAQQRHGAPGRRVAARLRVFRQQRLQQRPGPGLQRRWAAVVGPPGEAGRPGRPLRRRPAVDARWAAPQRPEGRPASEQQHRPVAAPHVGAALGRGLQGDPVAVRQHQVHRRAPSRGPASYRFQNHSTNYI
jgi:hypothetical protein